MRKSTIFLIWILGINLGALVTSLLYNNLHKCVIISSKKIEPEIRLTTDGKTIDTLYIYDKN